jgi:carbon monoxide dehydrogenase subunit G
MRVRASVIVRATPEQVFAFLDDVANVPVLLPQLERIENVHTLPDGRKRIAYVTRGRRGKPCAATSEQVHRDPPHRVIIEGQSEGVVTRATRNLTRVAEGTRLDAELEYKVDRPQPFGLLVEFQWRRPSRNALRQLLHRIQAHFETHEEPVAESGRQGA